MKKISSLGVVRIVDWLYGFLNEATDLEKLGQEATKALLSLSIQD